MNLDALAANITSLDPTRPPVISAAERDYFRFYGLNFEENNNNINHHFGRVRCGDFDIVAHYYENRLAVKTCFIVHGFFDHAGLYRHIIEYCLKRNFSVVIFDLPGHGLSTGERASISSFQDYQSVFSDLLLFFKHQAPTPWHAIGQSTGGAILMDFILSGGQQVFSKTVLLAPLVRPQGWLVSKIMHSIAKPFLTHIDRKYNDNSNDDNFKHFIKNDDPLQTTQLPLQWVVALKQWVKYFLSTEPVAAGPLVIQGDQDSTVDWQYNIGIIQQKFSNSQYCYLKTAKHHLANEREDIRQSIIAAMDNYLELDSSEL